MKNSGKTICLILSGVAMLFWLLYFFDDDFERALGGNTAFFFVPPILSIVFAIIAVVLGRNGKADEPKPISQEEDYVRKLKQAKGLFDSKCISEKEYLFLVDSIISKLK